MAKRYIVTLALAAATQAALGACESGRNTPEILPEEPDAYSMGVMTLTKATEFELRIGAGPILGRPDGICLKDSSLIVIDRSVAKQLHEYSMTGEFIRAIGSHGEGPGRYRSLAPRAMATDKGGRLYLYDGAVGNLKVFGADDAFMRDLGHMIGITDALVFDDDGSLMQLGKEEDGIAYLKRYDEELDLVYSTPLTDQTLSGMVWHFAGLSGFCVDMTHRCVYYVEPGGYRVREIDLDSGRERRVYGMVPPGYREVPDEYGSRETLELAEGQDILTSATLLHGGMYLLSDRYLMLGFSRPGEEHTQWLVYDVENPAEAYELDESGRDQLAGVVGHRSKGEILYGLSAPADHELDELNGRVTGFRLVMSPSDVVGGSTVQSEGQ